MGERSDYGSWGRVIAVPHRVIRPRSMDEAAAEVARLDGSPVLAHGNGRSYGDLPLNPNGRLIDCRALDRFIGFDPATGILTCEAGVQLADILPVLCRPREDGGGWMLPVTPGTRFITVAGAIANDVHGKNHHRFGTFGSHVLGFELARCDGGRLLCSLTENPELFAATIGGLGLTGLILNATLQLRPVAGLAVEAEDIRFGRLADYFALAAESDTDWEYTAAWIDCLAQGDALGRGIFSRARHVPGKGTPPPSRDTRIDLPLPPPFSLVMPLTVRAFNAAYWRKLGRSGRKRRIGSYEGAFYPLDAIGHWNRAYGPKGFYQFQCQLPPGDLQHNIAELLRIVAASGQASMLTTLKLFGDKPSPGLLSFPAPGATLAIDFANRGVTTHSLLARLERMVVEMGGRLYPAKDALMSVASFQAGYPNIPRFRHSIDPGFSSAFARRVGLIAPQEHTWPQDTKPA